ncbi:MAG: hypothetical protein F6K65_06645 [Moorea sp. SIO3C2]|nr:hypothetical protein [Moorena sp. SIO3C2]
MPVPQQDAHSKSLLSSRIDKLQISMRNYGGLHNYQVHKIFFSLPTSHFRLPTSDFPAPCSLLPAPCSLLPAPCSLLPAPCSLKTQNEST